MSQHRAIQEKLLAWYDRHRRDLPWRRTRDPYAIWVSEVMLQQTQVKTVLGHYTRFLARFPSVRALARAKASDVLHAWQGLGYYSRARRLHEAARAVNARHAGSIPRDRETLLRLPGVGAYSAGAIASIAFGRRVPVVDGNVVRVLTRLFALRGDPGRAPLRAKLWTLASDLVPRRRPGDFNQALMELGATLCTPKSPVCERCPLGRACVARKLRLAERLPEISKRTPPTDVRVAAAVVRKKRAVLVVRLPDRAPRWAGLYVFPHVDLGSRERAERGALRAARAHGVSARIDERLGTFRYTITRFRITLEAFGAIARTVSRGRFYELDELAALAMPAPHRRLANALRDISAKGRGS